jgi:NADH-quinone oxidoreductase subunit L
VLVSLICPGMVLISFLLSVGAVWQLTDKPGESTSLIQFTWLAGLPFHMMDGRLATFSADWGFLLDPLSAVMILVVTGIGFLIHVYSTGYMAHDNGYYRFFGYLNLFIFFMLMLVLANNYTLLFVGWEGVGLCSYLLIGFYFQKKSAGDAGKKAFIVNRVGDAGFILGMLLMFSLLGTVRFVDVNAACAAGTFTRRRGLRRAERDGAAVLRRRYRQVRAIPALCLAAGCHGRSHAGFGTDPRRNHGDGGRLHGGAFRGACSN